MSGPLRITGGFGTGKTTALAERAAAARAHGRAVLVFERPTAVVRFAAALVDRHVAGDEEQRALVQRVVREVDWGELAVDAGDPAFAVEVASTVLRYQSSFLGAEELLVHADAAGELPRWEALERFTRRYLAVLDGMGAVDRAGAIVGASMALRDAQHLAGVRRTFDDILVDDYQLADFATNRLLTQLAGRTGSLVVAGNVDAAIGSERGWSGRFLDSFCRRFDCDGVDLGRESRRHAVVEEAAVEPAAAQRITYDDAVDAVGREWPVVVVSGEWTRPRPAHRWFDPHLFAGPDVPSEDAREQAWRDEERRRFAVATTRATERTVIVASTG